MRLIFLDFDGVLHPVEPELLGLERFCWLPVLNRLLAGHADVYIVVHSTWRYEYTDPELRVLLGPLGKRFAGSAPRAPRELAIETVLQANRLIHHHLVLDDDLREFSGATVNLLLLDSQRGLSDEGAQSELAAWLLSTTPAETTAQGRDT
ncbi:HAD domain-containing protein [Hydrogenophaga sp.]|uniref:HAD domain-containing protein n=1 Tax=Hydrogenophaga sp. TaxID=1904254 RepID=UPI0039FD6B3B